MGALFLLGLIGSVLPFLPGPLLILVGAFIHAYATNFTPIGAGRLVILAALAVLAFVLDFVAGAAGTRRYGGSRWAVIGAVVGAVVGIFLGPFGILVGPVAGAIAGELLRGADLASGVRSGLGALVGLLAGIAADLVLALVMVGLFLWWVWRG